MFDIRVKAFFLIGLPGESDKTAAELEHFVMHSKVDDFDVSIYYPYKGTEIADNIGDYDLFLEDGHTIGYHKGKDGKSECAVHTSALLSEEIIAWRERIYSHHKRWTK